MSIKSNVDVFGKSYCKSEVLLFKDQNIYKFKLSFIF